MLEKDIKFNIKGRILKGDYSPNGEILFERVEGRASYYIYIWPNDGTKWPGTNKDMVYDTWYRDWDDFISCIEGEGWEVEWFNEEQQKADALKYAKYQPTDEEKEERRKYAEDFMERARLHSKQNQSNKSESE